jgi:hypothetical protein
MKKIFKSTSILFFVAIIILTLIVGLSGCRKPSISIETTAQPTQTTQDEATVETTAPETNSETTTSETQIEITEDLSEEVKKKFSELDKSVDNIGNIFAFIDQNIKDVSPELASEMAYTAIKLCEEYKFDFTDKFSEPVVQETIISMLPSLENIDLNTLAQSDNQQVKELAQEAIEKKYKLMTAEGFVMPLVDYKAYDIYRSYLTQEMKDYLDIKLDESERPSVMDAGIVIPIEDFVKRIIKSMDYVTKYPDSPRKDEVEQFNNGRIYIYLSGIDNNPVFDLNQKLLPERLVEYEDILTKYGDTGFGKILSDYIDLLAQENYIRTQKVNDFLNNL